MNEFKVYILAASLAGLAFLFVTEQVQATRMGYELGKAKTELKGRRDQVAYLRLQLERLQAPDNLARAARSRLGMRPPEPESLVVLGNDVDRPLVSRTPIPREESFKLSRLID
jgi:cell division protein FtsL